MLLQAKLGIPNSLAPEEPMARPDSYRCLILLLASIAAVPAGCSSSSESPAMRDARIEREGALRRSTQMVADATEKGRTERLSKTFNVIAEADKQDKKAINRDMAELKRWSDDEVKRWNQKQPGYREAFNRELKGDPPAIERTVPQFIY